MGRVERGGVKEVVVSHFISTVAWGVIAVVSQLLIAAMGLLSLGLPEETTTLSCNKRPMHERGSEVNIIPKLSSGHCYQLLPQ